MSRSLSSESIGTHKGCGGEVRFCHPANKYICMKCDKLFEYIEVNKK